MIAYTSYLMLSKAAIHPVATKSLIIALPRHRISSSFSPLRKYASFTTGKDLCRCNAKAVSYDEILFPPLFRSWFINVSKSWKRRVTTSLSSRKTRSVSTKLLIIFPLLANKLLLFSSWTVFQENVQVNKNCHFSK